MLLSETILNWTHNCVAFPASLQKRTVPALTGITQENPTWKMLGDWYLVKHPGWSNWTYLDSKLFSNILSSWHKHLIDNNKPSEYSVFGQIWGKCGLSLQTNGFWLQRTVWTSKYRLLRRIQLKLRFSNIFSVKEIKIFIGDINDKPFRYEYYDQRHLRRRRPIYTHHLYPITPNMVNYYYSPYMI